MVRQSQLLKYQLLSAAVLALSLEMLLSKYLKERPTHAIPIQSLEKYKTFEKELSAKEEKINFK